MVKYPRRALAGVDENVPKPVEGTGLQTCPDV